MSRPSRCGWSGRRSPPPEHDPVSRHSGEPVSLFTPAVVSDASDGQIAHLHGLNASRAWCWRRIAESLPVDDPRVEPALAAARTHVDAALPHVVGYDYMVEHWLACYAVLMLS
jgi:Protein of unknown function (DUF2891)